MTICNICILPETFPGISFNAEGICRHCQRFDAMGLKLSQDKKRYEQKFLYLLKDLGIFPERSPLIANRYSYDILMAYSGGKDSTYTLSLLKNKYRLRVLAVSFDNGFISETAIANIKTITGKLGIDHIFFNPEWGILKKIFSVAANRELYAKKTLERASTICTSCIGLVKSICLKMAIEQDIPMVGFGWSPGQAPVQSSIMKNNPSLIRMVQSAILNPLKEIAGDDIKTYFLHEKHYLKPERFPYNVHPMAWELYDEEMIVDEIQKLGWVAPRDTDSNSSNCVLNAFANAVHLKKYGFHPYVWEIANMVREGIMAREDGYKKIYQEQSEDLIKIAKEKLGI
jgi:3'-phosphoadenosine 5'-phosphosulfate sulfotransferase (PAPS reductase)/FAD synthetase